MYKEFFSKSPLLAMPLVSLAIFLCIFIGVIVYVIKRGPALERRAQLALQSEVGDE